MSNPSIVLNPTATLDPDREKMKAIMLESTIICPVCGHAEKEIMPTDACQFFYDCKACGALLKPKPGDCCVFCSYGSVKCPPIQAGRSCCGG